MTLFEEPYSKRALFSQVLWFLFWATLTGIGVFLHADSAGHGTHQQLGLPPCPSVLLFNRPCPGCGLTTSWTSLLHGNLAMAFHAHPLGPPLYLLFTTSAFLALYGYFKGLRLPTDTPLANRVFIVTCTIFMVFGIYRMQTTPNYATVRELIIAHYSSK